METRSKHLEKVAKQVPEICAVEFDDNGSCLGSRSSRSHHSNALSIDRTNFMLAKLREQQLAKKLELECKLKLQEARDEVELAHLKLTLSEQDNEENIEFEPKKENALDKNETIQRYLTDCEGPHGVRPRFTDNPEQGFSAMRLDLPKVELTHFDGNPKDYWRFIRQFEFHVEMRTKDDGNRLLYLINYCKGKAKEAIQECVMLQPRMGYVKAKQILSELFGQSHVVARALIDSLMEIPKVGHNDADGLTTLAMRMQSCQMALEQMNYTSDLNALHTLELIVLKLPIALREKWSRVVDTIYEENREPTYNDLTGFVNSESRIARSRFGKLSTINNFRNFQMSETPKLKHRSEIHLATSISAKDLNCGLCRESHELDCCPKYLELTVSDRWTMVKNLKRCFICLNSNHQAKSCSKRKQCSMKGCSRSHHPTLHTDAQTEPVESFKGVCASTNCMERMIYLGIVPVIVKGPKGKVQTFALLDNGSDTTLVSEKLMKQLGVQGTYSKLQIRTMTSVSTVDSYKCEFEVLSVDGEQVINVKDAFSVNEFPVQQTACCPLMMADKWSHLEDIKFPRTPNGDVTLLIGCDVPEAHWVLEQRIGGRKQPYAVKTLLGWVLRGPTIKTNDEATVRCTMVETFSIWENLKILYNHEFSDISDNTDTQSREEKIALNIVNSSTRLIDGHYEVPLPWRSPTPTLPNNLEFATCRLLQLRRRFMKQDGLLHKYDTIIRQHVRKGYAVSIENENQVADSAKIWYLPHHPVLNPKKPNKVRIVFDCAAKFRDVSLNDCLYQGPDTTANLVGILLRFRRYRIALTADIEEMFLQVKVPLIDRDSLRFLWWADGDLSKQPKHYQLTVHPFGATSSPFCANFALRKAVDEFGSDISNASREAATRDIYVDDCITSIEDVETAINIVRETSSVFRRAGFRLRKWMSNCREILRSIPATELSDNVMKIDDHKLPTEKALGLEWDADQDSFRFIFEKRDGPITRRNVLGCISSLYDPLGLVCPVILPAKILLQDLCRRGLCWDAPLGQEDSERWLAWSISVSKLRDLHIPRCMKGPSVPNELGCQLHVFSDASEKGYGSVAYIRYVVAPGIFESGIVMAKARVAPIKTVTIPRLELTAAVLAVRLLRFICKETNMEFDRIHLWTDSVIVLKYIQNVTSRFCTFVANRLTEIHDSTVPSQWRHVSSKENPADLASRGLNLNDTDMNYWLHGPEFLVKAEDKWPSQGDYFDTSDVHLELKKTSIHSLQAKEQSSVDKLLDRYSSWRKLQRAVAWLRRFTTYISIMRGKDWQLDVGHLKVEELESSRLTICKLVQMRCFSQDYANLTSNKSLSKGSTLRKLNPVMIDGVIRVGGRLQLSQSQPYVHPIILPKNHAVTSAIIRHYHELEGHSGVSHILATLRQDYWILQGGTAVKSVIRRCLTCKKQYAPSGSQQMAPLPLVRIEEGWYPFKYVGVDYFGPFFVKRSRVIEKRWGCLFTCLQCRAVHIEIAHFLTTDSFIMALIRFISRWSRPKEIYSDNGTNFVGAHNELRNSIAGWSQEKITNRLTSEGIKWNFHPPAASHRGGVWERMIRSIRRILCNITRMQVMTDETLTTCMAQIGRIVNDRPLVPLRDEPGELKPLRPSDLLCPRGDFTANISSDIEGLYIKRWKNVNHLTSVFWKRWIKEYLPTLQIRQKWLATRRNFQVGDLVLLVTETSRENWPLGVIDQVEHDCDNLVRTATVRTASGLIRRDVRKICLLEGVNEVSGLQRVQNRERQMGLRNHNVSSSRGAPGVLL